MSDSEFISFEDDDDIEIELTDEGLDRYIPGASGVLLEDDEEEVVEEEEKESDWQNDGDHSKFLAYGDGVLTNIPKHMGNTVVGCERAIAYLGRFLKEISRAIQTDDKNQIDELKAEDMRDKVLDFIDELDEAKDKISGKKRKKKDARATKLNGTIFTRIASEGIPEYYVKTEVDNVETLLPMQLEEPSDIQTQAYIEWERGTLTKEASSAKIYLMADPFLNEVSNIIIRSHVTYGRNIEDVYKEMASKYKFTDRDHLAVHSLLREKGLLIDRDFSTIGEELTIHNLPVGLKNYPA